MTERDKEIAKENADVSRFGVLAPENVIAFDPSSTVLNGKDVCRASFPSMFFWSFIQNNNPLYKSTFDAATIYPIMTVNNNTMIFFMFICLSL